jgi:hypothetical protein
LFDLLEGRSRTVERQKSQRVTISSTCFSAA